MSVPSSIVKHLVCAIHTISFPGHSRQYCYDVQFLVMLPLMYVIVSTFAAFFAINVGAMYSLLPGASSSFSLLFNCNLVTRFAAPLCFNYLHVLAMDRPTSDGHYTVFANRMGMQPGADVAIPFLGVDFNRWAPVMVLLVVWLTLVNAFGAVSLCGSSSSW